MKNLNFFLNRRWAIPVAFLAFFLVGAFYGRPIAADNSGAGADYRTDTRSGIGGGSHNFIFSSSRDILKPIFRGLPERVVLTEGDFYHREFSVAYVFPDSLKIDLIDGYNVDDAMIDMGGGRAFLYLSADHTIVDSTFLYIFSARHGRTKTLDTMVVSVVNRPLEIVSVVPDASSEILVSEIPIRIKFNEPVDVHSIDNGAKINDVRGEEFSYYFIQEENTLVIDNKSHRLPSRDTIYINLTSGLLDLAGHPIEHPVKLTFTTGPTVYPGDANDDGIVDKNDIVPVVHYWGYTGPIRTVSQSLEWVAQPAYSWEEFMAGFADVNGDGVINGDDICGIIANWGKKSGSSDYKGINSPEAPEKILGRANQTILKDIYTAVINCPEGAGRESIAAIFASLLFDDRNNLPGEYVLYQNFPNPFNPETIIEYFLPEPAQLKIGVYNIIGQKVYDLYDGFAPEGFGSVTWYGIDNLGKPVASGIYFYRLETESLALTKRMILIR